jgi:DNA ligase-1
LDKNPLADLFLRRREIMIDFKLVAEAFEQIANTSSNLGKESLLVKYADLEGFKDVMKFIYNPYIRTGIGKNKLSKANMSERVFMAEEFLNYFSVTRTGTQFEIDLAYDFLTSFETCTEQWLAEGMITKDLQIGVSITTLNKVYGKGFIPTIGIMRGMHASESFKGIYIATEKIDGNRRLIMNKPTGVEIYTRSGRRDYGLVDIEQEAKSLPPGYVYDCELAAVGDYADSIELRQATASIANSKGKRTGVRALVFDMIKQEDYDTGISKLGALGRKTLLASVFRDEQSVGLLSMWFRLHDMVSISTAVHRMAHTLIPAGEMPHIMALPILGIIEDYKQAMTLAQPIWDTGGEGLMLVEYRSPYEVNPNPRPTLLKIKATKEYICMCVGVIEHKRGNMLGAVTVEYYRAEDDRIYLVDVGSGFSDYLRDMYWRNPELIIGQPLEIESFGESYNAAGNYSLNCPIFKRIVGEKE